MVWRIFLLDDVRRHNPPLAILQVLPLIRAIIPNPEPSFEYIAIVAARLPWNAEPQLCGQGRGPNKLPLMTQAV
jgi:hypothetical protein